MESQNSFKYVLLLLLVPLGMMSVYLGSNGTVGEVLLVFSGGRQFDEPVINILKLNKESELVTLDVKFPEDLLQFIECCKQDTIAYQPIQSYLSRTNIISTSEREEEELAFKKLIKALQLKKRKLFRRWNSSEGVYGVVVNLEICECVVQDPNISFDRLRLLKVID